MDGLIRLDIALVERGLAATRSKASLLIKNGAVYVGGLKVQKPSHLVAKADAIEIRHDDSLLELEATSVGRGAVKLAHALELWGIEPKGICVDAGASTGGFTEIMLSRGADLVFAVDVGTDQLAPKLRLDKRVISLENTDIRRVTRKTLSGCLAEGGLPDGGSYAGEKRLFFSERLIENGVDFISADLSFISLTKVLPVFAELLCDGGALITLVKPQFEMEARKRIKGGVVKSEDDRKKALGRVIESAELCGLKHIATSESPILGGSGNKEYLVYFRSVRKVER